MTHENHSPGTIVTSVMAHLSAGSQSLAVMLGLCVMAAAGASYGLSVSVMEIGDWVQKTFGISFVIFLSGLSAIAVFSWAKISQSTPRDLAYWSELGMQSANGVSTLALTYTLLGISLGIGSLAGQDLTPDTIQSVIATLTGHFSMAFMTSVVGLPLSALLRAMVMINIAVHKGERS